MHCPCLDLDFRKVGPQYHLPLVARPFRPSKSVRPLPFPAPSTLPPSRRLTDVAASSAMRARAAKQDAQECGGLPANVRDLRPERPQSDIAHLALAPKISRRSFPNPDPTLAQEGATSAPVSRSPVGSPSARAHPKMADDLSVNRTKSHPNCKHQTQDQVRPTIHSPVRAQYNRVYQK